MILISLIFLKKSASATYGTYEFSLAKINQRTVQRTITICCLNHVTHKYSAWAKCKMLTVPAVGQTLSQLCLPKRIKEFRGKTAALSQCLQCYVSLHANNGTERQSRAKYCSATYRNYSLDRHSCLHARYTTDGEIHSKYYSYTTNCLTLYLISTFPAALPADGPARTF
jgi:hypothetical protein